MKTAQDIVDKKVNEDTEICAIAHFIPRKNKGR